MASGNINHYKQWARSVSGVGNAAVLPLWDGNGTVKVVVASEENEPLDEAIVSKVAQYIESVRPIGAEVTVVSATAPDRQHRRHLLPGRGRAPRRRAAGS